MVKINSFEFFEGIRPEGSKGCAEGREKKCKKTFILAFEATLQPPTISYF